MSFKCKHACGPIAVKPHPYYRDRRVQNSDRMTVDYCRTLESCCRDSTVQLTVIQEIKQRYVATDYYMNDVSITKFDQIIQCKHFIHLRES